MRRHVAWRIFAIALVLTRLVLADFVHLPTAQAAAHDTTAPMMMAGEHCPGMDRTPDHSGHPLPANDGTCCKSSQCHCLQAPALVVALQMPMVFSSSYADLPSIPVHPISGPPAVFFRPPI